MDSEQKRRLRKFSIPLFWIAEVYLLVSLVLSVFVRYASSSLEPDLLEASATNGLIIADQVFFDGFTRMCSDKDQNLISFPPPKSETDLANWGQEVRQHMDMECSVFKFDGKQIVWALRAPRFETFEAKTDSVLRLPEKNDSSMGTRTLGSYTSRRFSFPTHEARVISVRQVESPTVWGVVYDFKDNFLAYVRKLQVAIESRPPFDLNPVHNAFNIYIPPDRVGSSVPSGKYGLQIFAQNDSLLFATAGIDTTYQKYEFRHADFPVYWRVYNNGQDEHTMRWQSEIVADRFEVPWPKLIMTLFLMIVFAVFYRWIYKLSVS